MKLQLLFCEGNMSSFNARTETSSELIELLDKHFWSLIRNDIVHYEYGYETHIDTQVQSSLRLRQSTTAKHVRFAPDFIVYRKNMLETDYLFEYKVTKTPRYSFNDQQWFYGQIEADAFDNYMNLINAGVNVAITIYCPYHERPLLCDIPSINWIYGVRQRTSTSQGSGTDFYNIDLRKLKTFEEFVSNTMGVSINTINSLLNKNFYSELRNTHSLKTTHYYRSSYNSSDFQTGFNWLNCYK
jgi:hypothetical protein